RGITSGEVNEGILRQETVSLGEHTNEQIDLLDLIRREVELPLERRGQAGARAVGAEQFDKGSGYGQALWGATHADRAVGRPRRNPEHEMPPGEVEARQDRVVGPDVDGVLQRVPFLICLPGQLQLVDRRLLELGGKLWVFDRGEHLFGI